MTTRFIPDFNTSGTPFERIINVGGVPGGEAYLLINKNVTILFDSGFGCCGDLLVQNIKNAPMCIVGA